MRTRFIPVVCLLALAPFAQASDWPCFRGPNADGIAPEQGINKDWNAKPPKTLWKIALTDKGNSAPAVANGRLYIVDHLGKEDVVRAIDAETGKDLWHFNYPDAEANKHGFTVSTPLALDGKIYISSRKGKIHCLNAATGEKVWGRDLLAEFHGTPPAWDFCMSPVADGRNLLLGPNGAGAGLVALDKESGKTVWQSGTFNVSYASPVVATLNGQKQYLVFAQEGLYSLDPATGRELWNVPWPTVYNGKKGPTPVLVGNRIFVATTEGGFTGLIEIVNGAPNVVWKHKEMQDHFPTSIYYHSRIYGSSEPKFLICLDPANGTVLWKKEFGQFTSVIGIDDTVIALSGNTGEVAMIDASAADYKELGRCTPLGGASWAPPVIANGRLFVRNEKELACVDLK